jgi:hypothetical protein
MGPFGSKRLSSKPTQGPVTQVATASSIVSFDSRRMPSTSPPQARAPKIRASARPLVCPVAGRALVAAEGHGVETDGLAAHLGAAVVELDGHPDPGVDAEGLAHLLAQERPGRQAGDSTDHLADQVAVGGGVIAVRGAGLPTGGLRSEGGDDAVPVVGRHTSGHVGQAGGVVEEVLHEHALLAVLAELRPVGGDRRLRVELAAVDEHVPAQAGEPLGGGGDHDDGVPVPRPGFRRIRPAAPEVDDGLALDRDRHRGPDLVEQIPVGGERRSHTLEARIAVTLDLDHVMPSLVGR